MTRCLYCGRPAQALPALPGRYRCVGGHHFRVDPNALRQALAAATPRQL